jgi:NAD(P)-dependent dehydrogenase (short-subunit alcohol dehydrogenase family)
VPARTASKGTAIVIGVGPGLGLALARAFAGDGHPVAMIARKKERLDADAAQLTAAGHRAAGFAADAGNPDELGAAITAAVDELGPPDVLLYNAGVVVPDTPSELTGEEFAGRLAVNVVGAKVATDRVLPVLRDGRGSLLFTGGDVGTKPSAAYTSLSVGKAALRAFAYALHEQMGSSDVHAAILTIFGAIGSDEDRFAPDTIARAFLGLHQQPKEQWGPELVYP